MELNEEQAYPVSLGVHQNVSSCWETAPSHLIKHLGKSGMVHVLFGCLSQGKDGRDRERSAGGGSQINNDRMLGRKSEADKEAWETCPGCVY